MSTALSFPQIVPVAMYFETKSMDSLYPQRCMLVSNSLPNSLSWNCSFFSLSHLAAASKDSAHAGRMLRSGSTPIKQSLLLSINLRTVSLARSLNSTTPSEILVMLMACFLSCAWVMKFPVKLMALESWLPMIGMNPARLEAIVVARLPEFTVTFPSFTSLALKQLSSRVVFMPLQNWFSFSFPGLFTISSIFPESTISFASSYGVF